MQDIENLRQSMEPLEFSTFQKMKRAIIFLRQVVEQIYFYIICIPFFFSMLKYYYLDSIFDETIVRDMRYGPTEEHVLDIYQDKSPSSGEIKSEKEELKPVLIFFHGGAWSSGSKQFYSPLGKALQQKQIITVIPNYTLYPKGKILNMLEDIAYVLIWVRKYIKHFGGDPNRIYISGHSSGAHILSLFIMKRAILQAGFKMEETNFQEVEFLNHPDILISGFVGLSGVYDITDHYLHESSRAVEWISPMAPCMGGLENFHLHSPGRLLKSFPNASIQQKICCQLPPIHLIHGQKDKTVPFSSSSKLYSVIKENCSQNQNIPCYLKYHKNLGHSDIIFSLMNPKHKCFQDLVDDLFDVVN